MKRIILAFIALSIAAASVFSANAAQGRVTYSGNSGDFVFAPGSEHSPTDLFPDFKDVMPGDAIKQKITVKNDANNKVKVKIYLRSLGAHPQSEAFLSKLGLQVQKSEENETPYMFDATADQTAQLTDWVCLGTLYSGGEVHLDVTLLVPTELDSSFQDAVGYLDWEFKVEEFPVEASDPQNPQTGDNSMTVVWVVVAVGALCLLAALLLWRKKDKKNDQND